MISWNESNFSLLGSKSLTSEAMYVDRSFAVSISMMAWSAMFRRKRSYKMYIFNYDAFTTYQTHPRNSVEKDVRLDILDLFVRVELVAYRSI
jgi:hypothetical protein